MLPFEYRGPGGSDRAFIGDALDANPLLDVGDATDTDDEAMTDEELWLERVWAENKKLSTLYKLAVNGAVGGQAIMKVVLRGNGQTPRLIVLDPKTVSARWAPWDIDEVLEWRIAYAATDAKGDVIDYTEIIRNDGGQWMIENYEQGANQRTATLVASTVWPYAWCPIHSAQNLPVPNEFWGQADLTADVRKLNHSINTVLSNINHILHYHASPKTWGSGFSLDELQVDAFYAQLRQSLFEICHVPQVALGGAEDASRVSNLALRVMYSPLFQHIDRKKSTYGDMLVELAGHLLELGGLDPVRVVLRWPQVLPDDPMQVAQVALLHNQMGASKRTILARLGYNPLLEQGYTREEADNLGGGLLAAFDSGAGM